MISREPMSHVDTAWLRMDRPENLMQIVGVMIFEGRMDAQRFKRTVARRLLRYRRFRQIATLDSDGAGWVDDPDFDIDHHIHHSLLSGGECGRNPLQTFVADAASTPLNPARPLWEFHLLDTVDGNTALVVRIHHAIADGIALIRVMRSLTDEQPDAPEHGETEDAPCFDEGDESDSFWHTILEPITDAAIASIRLAGHLWGQCRQFYRHPAGIREYAHVAGAVAEEIARLASMPSDSRTRFKGLPGTVKRVAWSEPFPLEHVRLVSKVLRCSINDTLLASIAGALRSYLSACGDAVNGIEIRAMVPVNLREPGDAEELGNRFGLIAVELPVGIENPLTRLYETRTRMSALKGSYQGLLTFTLLGIAGMMPKSVETRLLNLLADKTTAVITNVPGDRQCRYFAGSRIEQEMVWVPQAGNIGMGISILSYNERVQFGLITDRNMVDDPKRIVEQLAPEFEKLLWLVLLENDERLRDPLSVEQDLAR